jgi:hypothetical protein
VLSLPGFLFKKLSPRGRRVATAIGILVIAVAALGTALLVPVIARDKRESARQDQARSTREQAAELSRLVREQRPRFGRLQAGAAPVPALERAVSADARLRVASREFPTPVRRTDCRRAGRLAERVFFTCTAVTSDIPASPESRGGVVGYPYSAALNTRSRGFAFCKTSGRPGEGSLGRGQQAELPRACGGEAR